MDKEARRSGYAVVMCSVLYFLLFIFFSKSYPSVFLIKMNRELKFRAWVISAQQMFKWGIDIESVGKNGVWDSFNEGRFDKNDSVLMQYVGRKNNLDVDIYEGDILLVKGSNYVIVGVVLFFRSKYVLRVSEIRRGKGFEINQNIDFSNSFLDIKAFGNIYENSELLPMSFSLS